MPELPEVETTRLGLQPHLNGKTVQQTVIRNHSLRWPITANLQHLLKNNCLLGIDRRAKYLLFHFESGVLLFHLGMSGSLSITNSYSEIEKHAHVDIVFEGDTILRYHDPRRFGAILWLGQNPMQHTLLKKLGPEPLSPEFSAEWLHAKSRGRKTPIKSFLMDQANVTGVGNIYANESLFRANIRPTTLAARISAQRYQRLVMAVQETLHSAIQQGGTTLRDFVGGDGKPGYFQQQLLVYGRGGLPCQQCNTELQEIKIQGRSSVYCKKCQR